MGVTLNEAKTCIQQARKESFNFLGYTFGPHRYRKDGHWYLGARPPKKAVAGIKEKVGGLLAPGNTGAWTEVRDRLNQILRGWSAYFSYGTRTQAYRAVDHYVADCVRHFLRRRHKVSSRGTARFSDDVIFSEMGVLQLRQVQLGPRESTVKPVGKPDAGNPHVRFDERGWETGRRFASVLAPILDSTGKGEKSAK